MLTRGWNFAKQVPWLAISKCPTFDPIFQNIHTNLVSEVNNTCQLYNKITSFGFPTQTDQRSDVEFQPITGGDTGQGDRI